ncbi:MAG: apolipoprotein N-acyltransferase [Planctomycetota bacterium]|nr:apolipoprotein N-acyltransferase [Planctomycetota bacterium]
MIAPAQPPKPAAPPGPWRYRMGNLLVALVMFAWVGAFMPQPLVLATVPGVVGWLLLVERCRSTRAAMAWTFLFGAFTIGYGYRWLAPTTQDFGNLPVAVSWLVTGLFGAAGILHGWVFLWIHRGMLARGRRPHPLHTVLLFVACEHLPMRLFPWKVGHGAVDVPPLVQAAEWGGVSAVSFVLLCLIVPIHEWIRWAFGRTGPAARPKAALATFLIGCALFGAGQLRYESVRAEEDDSANVSVRIALVQPNVGHKDKRAAERMRGGRRALSIEAYKRLTAKAVAENAELIIWPETAITDSVPIMEPKYDPHRTNGYLNRLGYGFIQEHGAKGHAFLVGAYERRAGRKAKVTGEAFDERWNVAALRTPGGLEASWDVYRKVYLIPFGEHIPPPLDTVLDPKKFLPQNFKMKPGSTEGELGEHSRLLDYESRGAGRTLKLAPFLCYEGILPEHIRAVCGGVRPDLLVSLTNDSWFGDSWEPFQHLNFTRFRAVEHRAPLVRATNTGISAFVSMTGDVSKANTIPLFEEDALVRDVKLVDRGPTLYVQFGYLFPWLAAVLALLGLIGSWLRPPPLVEA